LQVAFGDASAPASAFAPKQKTPSDDFGFGMLPQSAPPSVSPLEPDDPPELPPLLDAPVSRPESLTVGTLVVVPLSVVQAAAMRPPPARKVPPKNMYRRRALATAAIDASPG
jgi:hypothetical protein